MNTISSRDMAEWLTFLFNTDAFLLIARLLPTTEAREKLFVDLGSSLTTYASLSGKTDKSSGVTILQAYRKNRNQDIFTF